MKILINFFAVAIALSFARSAAIAQTETTDCITRDTIVSAEGIILTSKDRLSTPGSFQPPVEITIVAKTDSTNLRVAYAADQVIFNWEDDGKQLRVDGGPADGKHKSGAGAIPTDQYVAIKWIVTPKKQAIYVDNELRYEHKGDYSHIDNYVSVFPAAGSKVTVKSIHVKQLPTDAK
jgi:hypothetical protein